MRNSWPFVVIRVKQKNKHIVMKKQYTEPQTTLLSIKSSHMICTSFGFAGKASENGITSGDSRRRSDMWEEEEEEY